MQKNECRNLIKTLELELEKSKSPAQRQYNGIGQELRRKVFKLMYDIGFIKSDDTLKRKLFVINSWITQKTSYDKTLNELTTEELNKLIKQLYTVRRIYQEREKIQSQWN